VQSSGTEHGAVASGLKAAIIGAGPGGFYMAGALLKHSPATEVSLIERLAVPYGLVRYGVAPDHPSLKSVSSQFERTGKDPRVSFFGNTTLWRDTSLAELLAAHHAVILAIGAPEDRVLGLVEPRLERRYSASQIVGWYNSHPDHAQVNPDFGKGRVCIFGHGNVAADLARILLSPPERLAATDISERALAALQQIPVREVHLIGRRGPAETRFTAPVMAELLRLPGVETVIDVADPPLAAESGAATGQSPGLAAQEVMRLFENAGRKAQGRCERRLLIHFWSTPESMHSDHGVLQVQLTRRHRSGHHHHLLQVDAAISAAGFRLTAAHCDALPLVGDALANRSGRVLDATGEVVPGLYAVGWAARGANGTIGTCRSDAERLVQLLLADAGASIHTARGGPKQLRGALQARNHRWVGFDEWLQLDQLERTHGAACGRPRVKLPSLPAMLSSLDSINSLDRIGPRIENA
jgi:ferredoxin/flavodoxin---NADP+ reductase